MATDIHLQWFMSSGACVIHSEKIQEECTDTLTLTIGYSAIRGEECQIKQPSPADLSVLFRFLQSHRQIKKVIVNTENTTPDYDSVPQWLMDALSDVYCLETDLVVPFLSIPNHLSTTKDDKSKRREYMHFTCSVHRSRDRMFSEAKFCRPYDAGFVQFRQKLDLWPSNRLTFNGLKHFICDDFGEYDGRWLADWLHSPHSRHLETLRLHPSEYILHDYTAFYKSIDLVWVALTREPHPELRDLLIPVETKPAPSTFRCLFMHSPDLKFLQLQDNLLITLDKPQTYRDILLDSNSMKLTHLRFVGGAADASDVADAKERINLRLLFTSPSLLLFSAIWVPLRHEYCDRLINEFQHYKSWIYNHCVLDTFDAVGTGKEEEERSVLYDDKITSMMDGKRRYVNSWQKICLLVAFSRAARSSSLALLETSSFPLVGLITSYCKLVHLNTWKP